MHVAAESEAAFPSVTAERIGNLVKYTTNREIGRVAKKRVTFRRMACKQSRNNFNKGDKAMAIQFDLNALSRFSNVNFGDNDASANLDGGDGLVQNEKLGFMQVRSIRGSKPVGK